MSYSLENHLIWSQVMKNLSISYTSTLAYKLGHTFIGHCFTQRIIGCCALLARDAPALLFFLLFGNPTTSWSWCSAALLSWNILALLPRHCAALLPWNFLALLLRDLLLNRPTFLTRNSKTSLPLNSSWYCFLAHWSTAPQAPAGSFVEKPVSTLVLDFHCTVLLGHQHTVVLVLVDIAVGAQCYILGEVQ